jgi:hypothetical protein
LDNADDNIQKEGSMNTQNLHDNMSVPNYQIFCELVGEPVLKGNAQKAQFKRWSKYLKIIKIKGTQKWFIEKIYDVPQEIEVNSKQSKIEYIANIQKLIITMLARSRYNGYIFLSKNRLFKEIKMINGNYGFCKDNILKLSKYINVEFLTIEEFYTSSKSMLERNMNEALNKLKSKFLLKWYNTTTVCVVDVDTAINDNVCNNIKAIELQKGVDEYGDPIYEYVADNQSKIYHRKASPEELKRINELEKITAQDLGCSDKQELVKKGKWSEFKNIINNILFDEFNILFYYESYEIIYNDHIIIEEWMQQEGLNLDDINVIQEELELTDGIIKRLCDNVQHRHDKALEQYKDKVHKDDSVAYQVRERIYRRKKQRYLDDNRKLINTLISTDATNIKDSVKKIRLSDDIDT